MDLRTATHVSGVLGGVCWLTRYALDGAGHGDGTFSTALFWLGLVLLFAALLDLGLGLVNKATGWLRVVVGVAFPLLVWSVLEAVDPGTDPSMVDAVFGGALLLLCLRALLHQSRGTGTRVAEPQSMPQPEPQPVAGSRRATRADRHPRRSRGAHAG